MTYGTLALAALLAVALATFAVAVAHHARFFAYHRHKGTPPPHGLVWSLRHELQAYLILAWWHVAALFRDGPRAPPVVRGRPVVFVHGYTQDATNWHGYRRRMERAGRPTVAISMVPAGFTPLRWYARMCERWLDRLVKRWPDGVDVVAHSMGGIVLRIVFAARPDLAAHVRAAVTLGTPHRGTASARGAWLWPEFVELKRSSRLIGSLPELSELLPHARLASIAAEMDTIVYPTATALVPGSEQHVVAGVGHAGLLTEPKVLEEVERFLLDAEEAGRRATP